MYISRDHKVWLACAGDDTRPSLNCVHVERLDNDGHGVAVAANGYILVVVPVEMDDGEETCLVPQSVWRFATRLPKTSLTRDRLWLGLGEAKSEHVTFSNGWMGRKMLEINFPNWRGIVPQRQEVVETDNLRVLQPTLLSLVQTAMGAESGVVLSFGAERSTPVIVEPLGSRGVGAPVPPFGVIMPMAGMNLAPAPEKKPVAVGVGDGS